MAEPHEIVEGYRSNAVDQMKRASELLCIYLDTRQDQDLKRAMLAHENAAEAARHYFAVKHSAKEALVGGPQNRLRRAAAMREA